MKPLATPPDNSPLPPPHANLAGAQLRRAMGIVTLAWMFGSVWGTAIAGAPFSLFARHLGASEFQIGLLAALPYIASLVGVPASVLTERTGARKKIFLYGQYTQRLLWFPIALVPVWIMTHHGRQGSAAAVGIFLLLVLIMHSCGALGGPPWLSWMADIVPERVRGKYFSRRRQWGILSAIPAALGIGWLLDYVAPGQGSAAANAMVTLRWCAMIFLAAAAFGVADIHLFQYVPDIPMPPRDRVPVLRMMCQPLRNRQFLWFSACVAVLTFAITFMGQFLTFYLIDKVGVNGTGIQMILLVAPGLAQLFMFPVWGRVCDRMGKKPVLAIASFGLIPAGFGWCLMGSGAAAAMWLGYLLSAAGAALWAGVEVANLNFVLEFSGSRDDQGAQNCGSSYVAANSVIINIAGCVGGLASGVIAKFMRDWNWQIGFAFMPSITFYEILFIVSGLLRLAAAVALLPRIREDAAATTGQTLRYMVQIMLENATSVANLLLRWLRRPSGATPEAPIPSVQRDENQRPLHRAA